MHRGSKATENFRFWPLHSNQLRRCGIASWLRGSQPPIGATGAMSYSHSTMPDWQAKGLAHPACPQVVGKPTCLALIQSKSGISPAVAGWGPIDFQTRYNLPSGTKGSGQIVAIVDAYDNPNVASDLAAYRSNFGLGTANFTKYNQLGQTNNYPSGNRSAGASRSTSTSRWFRPSARCARST